MSLPTKLCCSAGAAATSHILRNWQEIFDMFLFYLVIKFYVIFYVGRSFILKGNATKKANGQLASYQLLDDSPVPLIKAAGWSAILTAR